MVTKPSIHLQLPSDGKFRNDPVRRNRPGFVATNKVVSDDPDVPYVYVEGPVSQCVGDGKAVVMSMGGIIYRPTLGDRLLTVQIEGRMYVIGQALQNPQETLQQMNNGDLVLNPPGDIIFNQGGDVLGLLEDYFPTTGGYSKRVGLTIASGSEVSPEWLSWTATEDCYLFNMTVGAEEISANDYWTATLRDHDNVVLATIASTVYMKSVPENVRFQKPIQIAEGQMIVFRYDSTASTTVWVDLDLVR